MTIDENFYSINDKFANDLELSNQLNDLSYNKSGGSGDTVWVINGKVETVSVSDEEFTNTNNIVSLDTMMSATVSQPDPRQPFKCNFSFSANFDIKLKLPNLNAPAPNFKLLYKIDDFANEVSKINDDIIRAIQSMGCCDVADAYNKNIVPIFRWFADHKDVKNCSDDDPNGTGCGPMFGGNTFPMMLLNIAETLIKIYLIVRPLVCLLRPVPGNPWFPFDIDTLAPVRWIVAFFDLYYDKIISGKIMDLMIDPVKDLRKKIDVCLFGGKFQDSLAEKQLEDKVIASINVDTQFKKIVDDYENQLIEKQAQLENTNKQIAINNNKAINIFKKYESVTAYNLLAKNNFNYDIFNKIIENNPSDTIAKSLSEMILSMKADPENSQEEIDNILQEAYFENIVLDYKTVTFTEWADENYKSFNLAQSLASTDLNTSIISKPEDKYEYLSVLETDTYFFINDLTDPDVKYVFNTTDSIYEGVTTYAEIPTSSQLADIGGTTSGTILDTSTLTAYFKEIAITLVQLYIQKNDLLRTIDNLWNLILNYSDLIKNYQKENNIPTISSAERYLYTINRYGRVSNLCDCFYAGVMSTFGLTGFIPMPAKVSTFFESGFTEVQGYEDVFIKYKDFPTLKTNFMELTLNLNFKEQFLSNDNPDEFNFNYSEDFVKVMAKEFKKNIDSIGFTTLNSFSNVYDNEDFIKSKIIYGDYTPTFLDVLDKKYGTELFTAFKFKTENVAFEPIEDRSLLYDFGIDDTNFDILTGDGTTTESLTILDIDYVPSNLKPSEIYKYKMILEKYKIVLNNSISAIQSDYDGMFKKDEANFYEKKTEAKKYITKDIDGFDVNQKIANDLYNEFFSDYKKIDLISDPRDLKVRHYLNENNSYDEGSAASEIQNIINEYINERTNLINSNFDIIIKMQHYTNERQKISDFENSYVRMSNIYSPWVYKKPNIPCQCDFFCKLIQTIINALLSLLNKLIQYIIGLIMDWFWKTPLGKLIKFLIAKIKCIMMLVNFKNDWQKLQELTDQLQEGLRHNIKLFKDISNCTDDNITQLPPPPPPPPPTTTTTDPDDGTETTDDTTGDVTDDTTGDTTNDGTMIDNPDGTTTIIGPDGTEIILPNSQLPQELEPVFTKPTESLPAELELSTGVQVGPTITYPDHTFPLLTFGGDDCMTCSDNETKKNNTLEFINS